MAGDWIKVEHATLDKPEVLMTAELLGIDRRHALGVFIEFWAWLDKNLSDSCPDVVRNVSKKSLDDVLHMQGFAACLVRIGWAEFDEESFTMHIVNAHRHNGKTAKTRALDAKRKREDRHSGVREMSGTNPDENRTREEKRREETTTPIPGFARFWLAWPASPRKVAKAECAKRWQRLSLEARADAIVAHVGSMKDSDQWKRGFEPAPLTYLNQKRWEDGGERPRDDFAGAI